MLNESINTIAKQYFEKFGPSITPVSGKRPILDDWQTGVIQDLDAINKYWPAKTKMGLGYLLGELSGVVAVDFDYNIYNVHEAIWEILPVSPVKKAGQKGFTGFYRYTGTPNQKWKRKKSSKSSMVVELLSTGCQTVIPPSLHPETGEPYRWLGQSLLELGSLEELPPFTAEHAKIITAIVSTLHDLEESNG